LEWFQDVGGGPQNGSLQAMRGWWPGDEFIGSLPDFLPELPCRRRAKYFLKKLFTAKRVSITVLGLQKKQVRWMRTPR
jgi:hypothetical protein